MLWLFLISPVLFYGAAGAPLRKSLVTEILQVVTWYQKLDPYDRTLVDLIVNKPAQHQPAAIEPDHSNQVFTYLTRTNKEPELFHQISDHKFCNNTKKSKKEKGLLFEWYKNMKPSFTERPEEKKDAEVTTRFQKPDPAVSESASTEEDYSEYEESDENDEESSEGSSDRRTLGPILKFFGNLAGAVEGYGTYGLGSQHTIYYGQDGYHIMDSDQIRYDHDRHDYRDHYHNLENNHYQSYDRDVHEKLSFERERDRLEQLRELEKFKGQVLTQQQLDELRAKYSAAELESLKREMDHYKLQEHQTEWELEKNKFRTDAQLELQKAAISNQEQVLKNNQILNQASQIQNTNIYHQSGVLRPATLIGATPIGASPSPVIMPIQQVPVGNYNTQTQMMKNQQIIG